MHVARIHASKVYYTIAGRKSIIYIQTIRRRLHVHYTMYTHKIFYSIYTFSAFLHRRNGTMVNLNGNRWNTAVLPNYTCLLNIYGCRISFYIISKCWSIFEADDEGVIARLEGVLRAFYVG